MILDTQGIFPDYQATAVEAGDFDPGRAGLPEHTQVTFGQPGKTGTAAKIDPDGTYSTSRYVASFVGLVPASKPKLVIMVMVDEPHGSIYGGDVAAPAFREIARINLQHLEVPPDAPRKPAKKR